MPSWRHGTRAVVNAVAISDDELWAESQTEVLH